MDAIKRGDETLREARAAHHSRTGHPHILKGGNFVECMDCGQHAHLAPGGATLLEHGRTVCFGQIEPEEF